MSTPPTAGPAPARASAAGADPARERVSAEAMARAQEMIELEEGATNRLSGPLARLVTLIAVGMSLFHLYTAYAIVRPEHLRATHLAFVLFLTFLVFPVARRFRHRVMWWDWLLAAGGIAVAAYLIAGGDDFFDRSILPEDLDIVFGVLMIVLILEAMRRSTGWIMPFITLCFVAYAFLGPWLPAPWTHKGYELPRLVGHMYMTLEGVFGTALSVSSYLIILFTIYGAFLAHSGAGRFYLDFSFAAMGGKPIGAGRTVTLASFLLGGPSGSGVATTVTLGAVAAPMLARVGYSKDAAGGLLSAGGLGAIISPPVLGAAAFLIAEFLKISYLDVLLMAAIPTCLYYLTLFLMVEIDVRKFGMKDTVFAKAESVWSLSKRYWFHFFSLVSIVAFMLMGFSPELSVFWATVVSLLTSLLRSECALLPYGLLTGRTPLVRGLLDSGLVRALDEGARSVLNVAATCAGAGIIVGVVTLTGLGLKFSSIVLQYAGNSLLLTAIYTALIVWIVGLAVPVTASYIICAVIAAPALMALKVPDFAAHMFIFYYAVLSEVSPPTALSPFAAASITGGDPYRTTLQCWKYTLPAFLVPFIFVLDPSGTMLLLTGSMRTLSEANWFEVARVTLTAAAGIAALAGSFQGWLWLRCPRWERVTLFVAGVLLVYPAFAAQALGFALLLLVVGAQRLRARRLRVAHLHPPG
jgi:TRAP transporter 4TM/12TM fusion protein